jgi:putative hemolysin
LETSGLDIAIRLLTVAGLILLNGFFVAAEFAIVTVRKTRIEHLAAEGHARARAALRGVQDPDSFVAACQLGITMASLALGWVGEPALAAILEPFFESFLPHDLPWLSSHVVAIILTFAIITFLHIIIGEQVPKIAAIHNPESMALFVAGPTELFGKVFRPFIWVVNRASDFFLRLLGMEAADTHKAVHSVEELQALVIQSSRAGVLEPEETAIAQRAFELGDLSAHDVMIPRTELASVSVTIGMDELIDQIVADGHSRFPVHQGSVDNVVGIVHVKDLLKAIRQEGASSFNLRRIMREPMFVPETLPSSQLIELMRRGKTHVAIVLDEYGGTAGLVTMEDIVERLIGTMQDEFEQPELRIQQQEDGSFLVSGLVNLGELSDALGIELESEDYSTIGGYVFGLLGRRPKEGDEVADAQVSARVETLDGLRIATLRVRPLKGRIASESGADTAA